jgi:DNA polymerase I-like protein with 3'-5' exonuclease and polymerase domains
MGRILTLAEAQQLPAGQLRDWAYNTLDVTGTREIADVLLSRLEASPAHNRTYSFERALQTPALSMMSKGVLVDGTKRQRMVTELKRELNNDLKAIAKMDEINAVWDGVEKETGACPAEIGKHHKWPRGVPDSFDKLCQRCNTPRLKRVPFSPTSSDQVMHLFYTLLKVPTQTNKKHEVSGDNDALDRIGRKFPKYKHITDAILAARDKQKQIGSLSARLSSDGRYPSSFNVGAAWTGRFSSSKNPFGEGGNLQNVAERHRSGFIPDPGYDIAYVDKMQAESNVVAHISGDEAYIEAHNSGDVHTYVTRLVWPGMPWTGDLKKDKLIAKQLPEWDNVPGHDFRFQAKRVQHGSNFGLTPPGIAMIAHIPQKEAYKAQEAYFNAFPGIRTWQYSIYAKIANHEPLINLLGRTINLFGRPDDPHTKKQALAFIPQSTVADLLDLAMLLVWDEYDPRDINLLAQVHDALLLQYLSGRIDIIEALQKRMVIPLPVLGRTMRIGVEGAVGKNWGHATLENPNGIKEL